MSKRIPVYLTARELETLWSLVQLAHEGTYATFGMFVKANGRRGLLALERKFQQAERDAKDVTR